MGYKEAVLGKILKRGDLCVDSDFRKGYLRGFWDTRNPEEADDLYEDLKYFIKSERPSSISDKKLSSVSI